MTEPLAQPGLAPLHPDVSAKIAAAVEAVQPAALALPAIDFGPILQQILPVIIGILEPILKQVALALVDAIVKAITGAIRVPAPATT